MNFNSMLKNLSIRVVPAIAAACIMLNSTVLADNLKKPNLKFNQNGTFKIVMFSDFQDALPINTKSIDAMNKILDKEKPDFVILGGDQVTSGVKNETDMKSYINQMVKPMEDRKIPWSHVYGNHDAEGGVSTEIQEKLYESHPYCLSQRGPKEVDGVGNYVLNVKSSHGNEPAFNIWGLDSHQYLSCDSWYNGNLSKDSVLPNSLQGNNTYDFIKFSQIEWYWEKSISMENQYKHKIPGLMFFHIPLPEQRLISNNPTQTGMVGEKNEEECNSNINSGLFSVLLQRGDIKGVFCGHDHVNNYVGTYCGIRLGYDANIGYAAYGLGGNDNDRLRGARVFEINENDPSNFKTRIRLATDN